MFCSRQISTRPDAQLVDDFQKQYLKLMKTTENFGLQPSSQGLGCHDHNSVNSNGNANVYIDRNSTPRISNSPCVCVPSSTDDESWPPTYPANASPNYGDLTTTEDDNEPLHHSWGPVNAFSPSMFLRLDGEYENACHDNLMPSLQSPEGTNDSTELACSFVKNAVAGIRPRHLLCLPRNSLSPPEATHFRFHATLITSTSMITEANMSPVTYLNKGQEYSLRIVDTYAQKSFMAGVSFRTSVHITFEGEEQRHKPVVCWNLWKEVRGTRDARQRGGQQRALEYVQVCPSDEGKRGTQVEVESASFDGFCIAWTPGSVSSSELNIIIRFNFLSTDFSLSKGVKGELMRLCAKTKPVTTDPDLADTSSEISYCKVKVFRDHGAERKLSNDISYINKSITKLKYQIRSIESGIMDYGKRKWTGGGPTVLNARRPSKVPKHRRTLSTPRSNSVHGGNGEDSQVCAEDDLQKKLKTLQNMLCSARSISVLDLKGDDMDDFDLHPVDLAQQLSFFAQGGKPQTPSFMMLPTPLSPSLALQQSQAHPDKPVQVNITDDQGRSNGSIEALDVDTSYRPPPGQSSKPVACFYILCTNSLQPSHYYRAIYPRQRSLEELNRRIVLKWQLDSRRIARTVYKLPNGLEVVVDDDIVEGLKDGQDMTLEWKDLAGEIVLYLSF